MSTSNKSIESVNWQEVPNAELGWDEANPEDVSLVKLQEKYQHKQVWEAKEAKKCLEAEEAEKRACEAEEAEKRAFTEIRSVHRVMLPWGGEKKKRLRKAWMVNDDNDNEVVVVSACKASKSETRVRDTMAQVVDRRMGEIMTKLQGLRKGMSNMAEANQDLTQVLYQGFQSINTLVNEVKIFGAEGYLPKPAPESEAFEDKLQEALQEVKEFQEE
ncbi:hypothetical protein ID866_8385 [Astraeus odoratus]|nr:hypothetical protein ID866_8385 [Astraeus odoratus]